VSETLPRVTVLIAARPDQAEVKAAKAVQALDYPKDRLDILIARGRQPSVQRNAGLRAARGELIYFLDDDSLVQPGSLRQAVQHFADPDTHIVGGPNLCPPDAPPLEQVFALVLASWMAFGPSRARYAPIGRVRQTSEKELILCNLLARRRTLLELGGFNEALYPNEENALMDAIQKRGGRLIHDPAFCVYRRPRRTLGAFLKMLMTYGRGRAEQFRVSPTVGSALNFIPPLFCLYLAVLPFLGAPALIPLAVYGLALAAQGVALVRVGGMWRSAAAVPLVFIANVLYGVGFWRGLFTRLRPASQETSGEVRLEAVPV
jgi:succinoglycan biosynthesis protein ExoA